MCSLAHVFLSVDLLSVLALIRNIFVIVAPALGLELNGHTAQMTYWLFRGCGEFLAGDLSAAFSSLSTSYRLRGYYQGFPPEAILYIQDSVVCSAGWSWFTRFWPFLLLHFCSGPLNSPPVPNFLVCGFFPPFPHPSFLTREFAFFSLFSQCDGSLFFVSRG